MKESSESSGPFVTCTITCSRSSLLLGNICRRHGGCRGEAQEGLLGDTRGGLDAGEVTGNIKVGPGSAG